MYISLRIRKRVMLCVIAVLSMLAAVAVMPTFAKEEKTDGIKLPIIMYHSIVKNEDRSGEYVITPIELEKDLLYLKQNGYTTVFVNDVIRYVKRGGELPEKPIILSFDDGTYNYREYLLPLLEKYDMKATVSIVGAYTDAACEEAEPDPAYSYLDWQDVSVLRDSGHVEIAITLTICTILKAGVESVSWREKATRITERYFLTTPRSFKRFAMNTVVFSQTFTPILSA